VLNATDMAGGETFAMVPRRFDDVCSKYVLGDLRASQPPVAGEAAQPATPCTTKIDIKKGAAPSS
jgi:hypothetical protein